MEMPARFRNGAFLSLSALVAGLASPGSSADLMRKYDLGFPRGNLVANFSFETEGQTWLPAMSSVPQANPRFRASALCNGCKAVTGSFVGRVNGFNPSAAATRRLATDIFPVLPGQAYTVSFYYRCVSMTGTLEPRVRLFADPSGAALQEVVGSAYKISSGWTFHTTTFTTPSSGQYADLTMLFTNGAGEGGDFAFDDVVWEEGSTPSYRGQISESVLLTDGLGRSRQAFTRLAPRMPKDQSRPACLEPYIAYASGSGASLADVRDRNILSGGKVGSDGKVTVGLSARVYGSVTAVGNIQLLGGAIVGGDATAHGTVTKASDAEITGASTNGATVPSCAIPSRTVTPGTQNIDVLWDQTAALNPGAYGDVHVLARGKLVLSSGSYSFKSLVLDQEARLALGLSGKGIQAGVRDNLTFGDRITVEFTGQDDPTAVEFYANQSTEVRIGPESRFFGIVVAPNATIAANSRAAIRGALYGKNLRLDPDVSIAGLSGGSDGFTYRVSGTQLDAFSRTATIPLPVPLRLDSIRYIPSLDDSANAFYRESAGRPEAGNFAFSRGVYADEPSPRNIETGSAGVPWRLGGGHTSAVGFRFAADLSIPAHIEDPNPGAGSGLPYTLNWNRDPDGNYTLSWTDDYGQEVQSAASLSRAGTDATLWKWSVQRREYHPNGSLRKIWTPLDVASGGEAFSQVYNFNSSGRLVSSRSPDRGLMKFWYNARGRIRFSQDEIQRTGNEYTYTDYDAKGRVVGTGTQVIPAMTQAIADLGRYDGGTSKTEHNGWLYDDLSDFQARTGLPLSDVMPGAAPQYGFDRAVCAYNRNAQSAAPGFAAKDRLVADFFSYDPRGNVVEGLKYIGAMRTPGQRRQRVTVTYDERDRPVTVTLYKANGNATVVNAETYAYDNLGAGRVSRVTGLSGKPLSSMDYTPWGTLASLTLGGDDMGRTGTRFSYRQNIQGWLKEMKAVQVASGKTVHQQLLGYENKAYATASVPFPEEPRYSGQITQQLYKYASDVNSLKPVRLFNYGYDGLGRMRSADYMENGNATPLSPLESIKFAELIMNQSQKMDGFFDYDLNGRITGQRSGGVSSADSARYIYRGDSYKLDHVLGKVGSAPTRDLTNPGNFQYDARGSMIGDDSKLMDITYGWDAMPVLFQVQTGAGQFSKSYPFYDAGGSRAALLETQVASGSEKPVRLQGYLVARGQSLKEWRETYTAQGQVQDSSEIPTLFGINAPLGRIDKGKYEFYVKNHQGSTMRVVDDAGEYAATGPVVDYHAYGSQTTLKTNAAQDGLTPTYTGKELDKATGLYYFGARYFDPDLGLWLTVDAATQFFNPYFYGGDPANSVDPNGLWSIGFGIVFGYDSNHGFHVGVGAAFDVDAGAIKVSANASETWSPGDGSFTTTLGTGGAIQLGIVGLGAQAGGAYNTLDGYTLHANIGANIVAIGAEIGTNHAWDLDRNYLGGNLYGELYLGMKNIASIGGGYEYGWGGFRTGFYANASFIMNNWSYRGDGIHYDGFEQNFNVASYKSPDKNHAKLLTNHSDAIGHSAIVGEYAGEGFTISVGPGGRNVGSSFWGVVSFFFPQLAGQEYETHEFATDAEGNYILGPDGNPMPDPETQVVNLTGLDYGKLQQYAKFISGSPVMPYNFVFSCSFYTSLGILYAGGFSIGGNVHPFFIESETVFRQNNLAAAVY